MLSVSDVCVCLSLRVCVCPLGDAQTSGTVALLAKRCWFVCLSDPSSEATSRARNAPSKQTRHPGFVAEQTWLCRARPGIYSLENYLEGERRSDKTVSPLPSPSGPKQPEQLSAGSKTRSPKDVIIGQKAKGWCARALAQVFP